MYSIAIVGATGLVGSTFLKIMEEYQIPVKELKLYATEKSKGTVITYLGNEYIVDTITTGSFSNIDFALFSAGGTASIKYAKQAVNEGAVVIDNSNAFRMDSNVPLVIPEVNISAIKDSKLIANPNCSTIQVVLPLKVLQDHFGIESINYTTYQAVSGSGVKGIEDLKNTRAGNKPKFYPYNISETCIPQIDLFEDDGFTKEEHKMINETRKILNDNAIKINATCVRVPIENCHAVSVQVLLKEKADINTIRELFNNQSGLVVKDDISLAIYPLATEATNTDAIYIGRIREDKINENGILFYTVSDNIRKGAASNAVQIMKALMEGGN